MWNSAVGQPITWKQVSLGSYQGPLQWTQNQGGYSATIAISGNIAPYQLAVTGLPTGLTASLSGSTITISGKPTQAGTFSAIKVSLSLANTTLGAVSKTYSLTVNGPVQLSYLPHNAVLGESFYNEIQINGGVPLASASPNPTYNVTVTGLPPGVTYSVGRYSGSTRGVIILQGTPTQTGMFNIHVSATDAVGAKTTTSIMVTVYSPLQLGDLQLSFGTVLKIGNKITGTIEFNGGDPSQYSKYNILNASGPTTTGVVGSTLTFSFTPTQAGPFSFTLTVPDGGQQSISRTYSITIPTSSGGTVGNPTAPTYSWYAFKFVGRDAAGNALAVPYGLLPTLPGYQAWFASTDGNSVFWEEKTTDLNLAIADAATAEASFANAMIAYYGDILYSIDTPTFVSKTPA